VFICLLKVPFGYNKQKVAILLILSEGIIMPVSREDRVLVIVNCLAEHGDSRFRRLYRFIERAGVSVARRYLSSHYRLVSVLKDQEATRAGFLSLLGNLAADQRIRAIDLFFQLHGLNGKVRFSDQWVFTSRLSEEIRQAVSGNCLRLVYNTSCYGDSHSADFLKAGFKVSVGSLKVNTNAATEYPVFCRLWRGSGLFRSREVSVAEIMRRADRPLLRRIQDWLAGRYFRDADSKKNIRGNGAVTIATRPVQQTEI
jgi:hypothetical protein